MKKLLITTMAAVSVGLCAKADLTVETFELYSEGSLFGTYTDEEDGVEKYRVLDGWYTEPTLENLFTVTNIANYVGDGTYPEKADRPSESDSVKALAIDTSAPLLRYADSSKDPQSLSDAPIFFDSVVQFTATDVAPSMENNTTDKLAVWLYQSPEDVSETNPGLFKETTAKKTLVITAGVLETNDGVQSIVKKDYDTGIEIEPESWHRLTIKSFLNEGKDKLMFNVWIDGAKDPITAEGVTDFLSLVTPNEDSDNYLQGVAFDGKGAVDDIVFTTTDPFYVPPEIPKEFFLNLALSADDAAEAVLLLVKVNGETVSKNDAGVYNLALNANNIEAYVECASGYEIQGASYDSDSQCWIVPINVAGATENGTVNVTITVEKAGGSSGVTYPTVKPNGDSTTQETLSESAVAAIEEALAGVETMPDALTVIVNEKEYFGDEAVAKINEVVAMFKAAKEGETLKFFDAYGVMKVSFKATNPLMETETAEATDYEAKVGEVAAAVTSDYTVNKETVNLTPGVAGENEAVTFKLVIKPVSSTGSDTGLAVQE